MGRKGLAEGNGGGKHLHRSVFQANLGLFRQRRGGKRRRIHADSGISGERRGLRRRDRQGGYRPGLFWPAGDGGNPPGARRVQGRPVRTGQAPGRADQQAFPRGPVHGLSAGGPDGTRLRHSADVGTRDGHERVPALPLRKQGAISAVCAVAGGWRSRDFPAGRGGRGGLRAVRVLADVPAGMAFGRGRQIGAGKAAGRPVRFRAGAGERVLPGIPGVPGGSVPGAPGAESPIRNGRPVAAAGAPHPAVSGPVPVHPLLRGHGRRAEFSAQRAAGFVDGGFPKQILQRGRPGRLGRGEAAVRGHAGRDALRRGPDQPVQRRFVRDGRGNGRPPFAQPGFLREEPGPKQRADHAVSEDAAVSFREIQFWGDGRRRRENVDADGHGPDFRAEHHRAGIHGGPGRGAGVADGNHPTEAGRRLLHPGMGDPLHRGRDGGGATGGNPGGAGLRQVFEHHRREDRSLLPKRPEIRSGESRGRIHRRLAEVRGPGERAEGGRSVLRVGGLFDSGVQVSVRAEAVDRPGAGTDHPPKAAFRFPRSHAGNPLRKPVRRGHQRGIGGNHSAGAVAAHRPVRPAFDRPGPEHPLRKQPDWVGFLPAVGDQPGFVRGRRTGAGEYV